jgi:hypothetical protein
MSAPQQSGDRVIAGNIYPSSFMSSRFQGAANALYDRRYCAGQTTPGINGETKIVGIANGTIVAMPFFVNDLVRIDRMSMRVTAPGAAGTKARFGIYTSVGRVNPYPKDLIVQAAEQPVDVAALIEATVDAELPAYSLVWMAAITNGAVGAPAFRAVPWDSSDSTVLGWNPLLSRVDSTIQIAGHGYGPLPAVFPDVSLATLGSGNVPVVAIRFKA